MGERIHAPPDTLKKAPISVLRMQTGCHGGLREITGGAANPSDLPRRRFRF